MKLAGSVIGGLLAMLVLVATASAQPMPPDAYPAPPPDPNAAPPPPPPSTAPPPPGYAPPPGQPYQRPPYPGYPGHYAPPPPMRVSRPFTIYAEIMGKGVLYGVGADYNFTKWLGIGSTFSYIPIDEISGTIIAPYLNFYPAGGWKSSLLMQAGPWIFVEGSHNYCGPGDFWGFCGTRVAGQASIGYEYRSGFLFRVIGSLLFSQEGAVPWIGFTFGGAM
jgi:hypothetical protein